MSSALSGQWADVLYRLKLELPEPILVKLCTAYGRGGVPPREILEHLSSMGGYSNPDRAWQYAGQLLAHLSEHCSDLPSVRRLARYVNEAAGNRQVSSDTPWLCILDALTLQLSPGSKDILRTVFGKLGLTADEVIWSCKNNNGDGERLWYGLIACRDSQAVDNLRQYLAATRGFRPPV